jgi:hypothetical protein
MPVAGLGREENKILIMVIRNHFLSSAETGVPKENRLKIN